MGLPQKSTKKSLQCLMTKMNAQKRKCRSYRLLNNINTDFLQRQKKLMVRIRFIVLQHCYEMKRQISCRYFQSNRQDFDVLSSALDLRFGEKRLKDYCCLQLKSVTRKRVKSYKNSHFGYSDCPADVPDNLEFQCFIDGIRYSKIQIALRMADINDVKFSLIYMM